ncbi:hypothetical protein Pryu01_01171 [Paraliobacillus ryukyuensis]|uniref:Uncharacterized protein DUF3951 n=1 Tax=Paraliobacillus ryukyuensis TaxID=200904 RepID=A0A366ECZ0_9BACI|nr:DUF3951 domain-containing protein [Paraliobacillus ryukyuensis]RBP00257.1 uncharacterized protein DUF3951 [Paraliobacillus ryukyuensis]
MGYVFAGIFVAIIGFITYREIKHKSKHSVSYTPYDDMTTGSKSNRIRTDGPIYDTIYHIQYEK